jgi:hypothetical protein
MRCEPVIANLANLAIERRHRYRPEHTLHGQPRPLRELVKGRVDLVRHVRSGCVDCFWYIAHWSAPLLVIDFSRRSYFGVMRRVMVTTKANGDAIIPAVVKVSATNLACAFVQPVVDASEDLFDFILCHNH